MSGMRAEEVASSFAGQLPASLGSIVTTAGCLIGTAVLVGCGGSPPPETSARPMVSPEPPLKMGPAPGAASASQGRGAFAAPTEYALPAVGSSSVETLSEPAGIEARRSLRKEAAIRTYLADRFIFEAWYSQVREIVVRDGSAAVFATLSSGGEGRAGIANEICTAVLASGLVGEVRVRDGPRFSVACP